MSKTATKNIAIFASGTGSNATKIVEYFSQKSGLQVQLIVTNNSRAGVLKMAAVKNIPALIINRSSFYQSEEILERLKEYEIDCIALAGFLWLVPPYLITAFPEKIINIHPALLPQFGGKGMYGMNVHRAVKESRTQMSGITLHYVNERYDEGNIIFQASCPVFEEDTAQDIRNRVLQLEHTYFPRVLEDLLL